MEKLVVKTAVKTVLIILGIIIAVFAVFNFAFPQHMATATESIGNYDLAVKYASLRYYYTKNSDDLARCFDDSVLLGKDEYILQYGEQLVNHRDYAYVCERKNSRQTGSGYDYDHWVKGKLAVSYYNTGKTQKAVEMAAESNGNKSFAYGNALMSLAVYIRAEHDVEAANAILEILEQIEPAEQKEQGYLTTVIAAMRGVN
ncbi:MAG: hypothetical protein NC033_06280 [Clostridiales bacterium]|nr:hypothetical protein [Clostridiales bacterium]